jgi:hypothetical protein
MQRCSKCKKYLAESSFGYNTKGELFKTCLTCRENQKNRRSKNKPIIIDVYDNNEPTNENETIDEPQLTQEDNDCMGDLLEKMVYNDLFDSIDLPSTFRKLKELKNKNLMCDPDIIYNTLSKYYKFTPMLCRCGGNCSQMLVQSDNSYCILEYCNKISGFFDMKFIFSDKTYFYKCDIPSVNLFDGFTNNIRLKNGRRCVICSDHRTKNFVQCSRCSNRMCHTCFDSLQDKSICSYCRYTINDHLNLKIDELNIRPLCVINKERIC